MYANKDLKKTKKNGADNNKQTKKYIEYTIFLYKELISIYKIYKKSYVSYWILIFYKMKENTCK